MYWTFDYNGESYASWGSPRKDPCKAYAINKKPRFDVEIYSGKQIKPEESVVKPN